MSRCPRCEPVPEEVRRVADLLERRWTISIIFAASAGEVRFNAFIDSVPGISPRMLSERLRDLEHAGMIQRIVHVEDTPPSVEYRLTERGEALRPLIDALRVYAQAAVRA
ncbi:MAG: helix-turn-helix domain-containing protein [Solirubrobacteraceae bacterium]|jgi:DNA-binding HxlR family transcriptional regulator